ncbi:hypothetical protein ACLOJK_014673 [Asimina triloba]
MAAMAIEDPSSATLRAEPDHQKTASTADLGSRSETHRAMTGDGQLASPNRIQATQKRQHDLQRSTTRSAPIPICPDPAISTILHHAPATNSNPRSSCVPTQPSSASTHFSGPRTITSIISSSEHTQIERQISDLSSGPSGSTHQHHPESLLQAVAHATPAAHRSVTSVHPRTSVFQ